MNMLPLGTGFGFIHIIAMPLPRAVTVLRRSTLLAIVAHVMLVLVLDWHLFVMLGQLDTFMNMLPLGTPESLRWFGLNGQYILPIVTSPLAGLWVNVGSPRILLLMLTLLTCIMSLLFALSIDVATIAVAAVTFSVWSGTACVIVMNFVATYTSIVNRTRAYVAMYFGINVLGRMLISCLALALKRAPSMREAGFVFLGGYLIVLILFALMHEPPRTRSVIAVNADDSAVGGPTPVKVAQKASKWQAQYEHRNAEDTEVIQMIAQARSSESLLDQLFDIVRIFFKFRDVSWPAVFGCLLLVTGTIFGFNTFTIRVDALLAVPHFFSGSTKAALELGVLGGVCLSVAALLLCIRFASDRALLIPFALLLALSFLSAVLWGSIPMPTWQFVSALCLNTLADNFVMAVATSLFSKLVLPSLVGIWLGLLESFVWIAKLCAALCYYHGITIGNEPYWAALGLFAVALLLMLPFFRDMVPQLHSPWSGGGLPITTAALMQSSSESQHSSYGSVAINSDTTDSLGVPSRGSDNYRSFGSHGTPSLLAASYSASGSKSGIGSIQYGSVGTGRYQSLD
eukprot:TRINITY_DN3594_c0_g1_i1.p1 TRINITY_DN3594_c0_g1~~TRINITY_DN3594_c0_g1_i1.p1  ORF type:complete len:570 (+),score=111.40 TRINITY_DN3594_c0_g1_i1:1-1710(+)